MCWIASRHNGHRLESWEISSAQSSQVQICMLRESSLFSEHLWLRMATFFHAQSLLIWAYQDRRHTDGCHSSKVVVHTGPLVWWKMSLPCEDLEETITWCHELVHMYLEAQRSCFVRQPMACFQLTHRAPQSWDSINRATLFKALHTWTLAEILLDLLSHLIDHWMTVRPSSSLCQMRDQIPRRRLFRHLPHSIRIQLLPKAYFHCYLWLCLRD